jgi:hypothetical protein
MVHHPGFAGKITDLPTGLYSSAHWIWDRRGTAKAAGFPFSEETVTETILLDLASALSHMVHIIPFTKPQEGKTGADWEWCLYDLPNDRYLRFLMQAKVLDDKDKHYAHIDRYIGNSSKRQIDRLAETAMERGIPAIYVFYNHLSDETRVPIDRCACGPCLRCWGASIAPLDAVRDALPDKSFDSLRDVSMPWLCLLCAGHGIGPETDPISGAIAGLARLNRLSREQRPHARRDDLPTLVREPERDPPTYIRELLELTDRETSESRTRLIDKIARDNPNLDGVALIDATRPRRRRAPRVIRPTVQVSTRL